MRHWPLTGLRVSTPLVELRWPTADDLDELATRAVEGVHDPATMPFFSQWTDGTREEVARRVIQRHWTAWGTWRPQDWTLYLVVRHQGVVVGSQSIGAVDFPGVREVVLTSWLGRRFHGMGIGGHARAAMLHLAFSGLGAEHALTVVRSDNEASRGVCHKFGFTHDGLQHNRVRGERATSDRWRLDSRNFDPGDIRVSLDGLEAALPEFGLRTDQGAPVVPVGPVSEAARPRAAQLSGVQMLLEADADVGKGT